MTEEEFLIIVEPIEFLADKLLEKENQLERCIIIKGEDQELFEKIYEPFGNTFGKRVSVVCSPNYDKICSSYYHSILKIVKDHIYMQQVNINTIKYFSKEWQKNFTLNLFYAYDDVPLKCLEHIYNVPVVVASGGPSLTKQIPLLKKVRKHILLISSGSTINSLLKYDIEPDFIVTIDGGINNYRHFETIELKQARIIYSLSNHEKIRERFNRRSLVFISNIDDDLKIYAQKLLNKEIDGILGGASVANFALNIAYMISTGPVALIGQDLAYTDNKTHAEHNKNFRKIDETYIKQRGLFYTEGYYGGQVLTDYTFFTMKHNFERLLQTFSQPERIYNCTEGGVKLEGYQQLSFQEFFDRYVDTNKNVPMFDIDSYPHRDIQEWKEFLIRIENEIRLHDKVQRLAEEAVLLLKRNVSDTAFDAKILKKLDKIDEQLKPIFDEGMMSLIAQPIVLNTFQNYLPKENELEHETFQRIFARSLDLYTRLKEAASDSRSFFQHLKNKIENKLKSFDIEG
ncbi:6-hydroxymethylpterin diphosphokinase MptE-like protein [Aeribacillus sp. FSL K6-1305]|uniref:motility associated factor glycosyltransferase family protein n=1 Tax=Aeribacillus sp. FSL K6-1305 TaxID=2954569 RepID=UPI0030FD6B1C